VVTDAATEAERSRDDDRASYKDTHGLSPIRSVCMGKTIYAFARESCDTWDTGGGEKMGRPAVNPLKKAPAEADAPRIQNPRQPASQSGLAKRFYGQTIFQRPKMPCFQKQLGRTGGPQAMA